MHFLHFHPTLSLAHFNWQCLTLLHICRRSVKIIEKKEENSPKSTPLIKRLNHRRRVLQWDAHFGAKLRLPWRLPTAVSDQGSNQDETQNRLLQAWLFEGIL